MCIPGGMPSMMSVPTMEYVITPRTTYIAAGSDLRRIFTDGRPWPTEVEPTYQGYAIGKWIDENGDGVYGVLEAETRGPFKGPRAYDATGLPLHFDNQSTFKERFHLDKNDPNLLHDEITVFDHALTRPWSVDKTYKRNPNPYPNFSRVTCMENTHQIVISKENYFLSADGLLMPAKKDQPPPDLRISSKRRSDRGNAICKAKRLVSGRAIFTNRGVTRGRKVRQSGDVGVNVFRGAERALIWHDLAGRVLPPAA
jgi:hypothetical protein